MFSVTPPFSPAAGSVALISVGSTLQ
jgi:hypothetical protein